MKPILILITLLFLNSCDNNKGKVKIDSFIWIQHNRNWIWNPNDLKARVYLEYLDSCDKIRLAMTNLKMDQSEFYISDAPDSLRVLIINNLYSKRFPVSFEVNDSLPHIYDGDCYSIIYKFSDGVEQIFNYIPRTLPDSLRKFAEYIEYLVQLNSYKKTGSFDRTTMIEKYRDIIAPSRLLAPSPPPDSIKDKVNFFGPPYSDSILH